MKTNLLITMGLLAFVLLLTGTSGASNEPVETVPLSVDELTQLLNKLESEAKNITKEQFASQNYASDFMSEYNYVLNKMSEREAYLSWQFETDINDANEQALTEHAPLSNRLQSIILETAPKFLNKVSKHKKLDLELKRMLVLASAGIVYKNQDDLKKLASLQSELESIYATAKVCRPNATQSSSKKFARDTSVTIDDSNKCLPLDPDLTAIMQNSRDYDELLWAWTGWHNESGRKMRSIYAQTVAIKNQAARDNNYKDLSEYWISDFEDDKFEKKAAKLFKQVKPLYQKIHAYVRDKLESFYGSHYPKTHDPKLIPAHLLGNMWAQSWDGILDLVRPYPGVAGTDVTKLLSEKNYTVTKMFQEAESFFSSIGLFKMTPEFWAYSMIERPEGREVVCHASAYDLFNGRDFRIKMCTVVNGEDFNTIHHEMGHIEYFMAYKDQPAIFKTGANSAFHEAIGDTIALSVQTKKHLKAIGMVDDDSLTEEQHINYLMEIALQKVVFLPFAYLMDNWRWNVFRGKINESNYNQKWWEMRKELQGLEPPVPRSEQDFDPGAKYHIAAYVPYARYYISHFLQFQFYKSLCGYANHTGPLHTCDFYNSEEAGSHLKNMLELGASMHWSYALEKLSGQSKVTADAILEYFKPLSDWLEQQNLKQSNSNLVM